MQAVQTQEAQPSLFVFRLPKPKRFPARLSFFAQDIVERLIKQPSTAEEIAEVFGWEYDAVIEQLRTLSGLGLVCPVYQCVDGDLECSSGDCDEDAEYAAERGDTCACGVGILKDSCGWRYSGGPISEFYKYIQTKGTRDGIQS